MSLPSGWVTCVRCGRVNQHAARNLCFACWRAADKAGELAKYPKSKGKETQPLPVRERPPFEYTNDDGEAELIAEQEKKDAALQVLKDALQKTERLDDATKKKILACNSEDEIRKILESLPKRFPFRANSEGFLEFIG